MKWRSARSPNPTSAIWTPGGYQRDKIGKLGRSKCGAAPTAVKMFVLSARWSISCLITLIRAAAPAGEGASAPNASRSAPGGNHPDGRSLALAAPTFRGTVAASANRQQRSGDDDG